MTLYPERIVADLAQLPGANHTFLKQLCGPDGGALREAIEASTRAAGPLMADRLSGMLSSLDNRRFFQGFAELSTVTALGRAGWRVQELLAPGPRLRLGRHGAGDLAVTTLAFLHQTRPGGDGDNQRKLVAALGRVQGRHRFAVHVRRWLPHDFDPEPIRRAVEMWLRQVQAGTWNGRYAPYEDEHISLEFALTGEKVKGKSSPVALAIGPFYAHRALAVVEPKAIAEMDRHANAAERDQPLLLVCASDQPWRITPGYIRDFLYGRASCVTAGLDAAEWEFGGSPSVCAFRDPLYRGVVGVLFLDRDPAQPTRVRAEAWLNPWAAQPLGEEDLGVRCFSLAAGSPPGAPRLRWSAHPIEVDLG